MDGCCTPGHAAMNKQNELQHKVSFRLLVCEEHTISVPDSIGRRFCRMHERHMRTPPWCSSCEFTRSNSLSILRSMTLKACTPWCRWLWLQKTSLVSPFKIIQTRGLLLSVSLFYSWTCSLPSWCPCLYVGLGPPQLIGWQKNCYVQCWMSWRSNEMSHHELVDPVISLLGQIALSALPDTADFFTATLTFKQYYAKLSSAKNIQAL